MFPQRGEGITLRVHFFLYCTPPQCLGARPSYGPLFVGEIRGLLRRTGRLGMIPT
jgi:hypothetical protein